MTKLISSSVQIRLLLHLLRPRHLQLLLVQSRSLLLPPRCLHRQLLALVLRSRPHQVRLLRLLLVQMRGGDPPLLQLLRVPKHLVLELLPGLVLLQTLRCAQMVPTSAPQQVLLLRLLLVQMRQQMLRLLLRLLLLLNSPMSARSSHTETDNV